MLNVLSTYRIWTISAILQLKKQAHKDIWKLT